MKNNFESGSIILKNRVKSGRAVLHGNLTEVGLGSRISSSPVSKRLDGPHPSASSGAYGFAPGTMIPPRLVPRAMFP